MGSCSGLERHDTLYAFPRALARIEGALPKESTLERVDQLVIQRARVDLAYARSATVTLSMTYLTGIMRAAYLSRRIGADPTVGTRSQRRRANNPDRVGPDAPTREEVAAIWSAAPAAYRAAVALGATLGLRVGEVLGLTADRVEVENRQVNIDRQLQLVRGVLQFTTPKGENALDCASTDGRRVIRRHLRDQADSGLLFRSCYTEGMRRDQFYRSAWRPALAGAGLPTDRYVFHSLRHFAASSMLAEGVNPMAVAGHLGDTLETLQRVYAQSAARRPRRARRRVLERILVVRTDNLADFSRTADEIER